MPHGEFIALSGNHFFKNKPAENILIQNTLIILDHLDQNIL